MMDDAALDAGEQAERRADFLGAIAVYESALLSSEPRVVAEAQFRLGRVAWRQGRFDAALRYYQEARSQARRLGDAAICAQAENGIGAVHYARGEYTQARACYRVALDLVTDPQLRAKILLNTGVIANIQGDLDEASALYARSLQGFRAVGDESGASLVLHNLGMLHADRGEWDDAEDAYARCLAICDRLGARQMVAKVLLNRAELHCALRRAEAAVADCDRSIAIADEIGDEIGRADALRWKGYALRLLGELGHAEQALGSAMRIALRLHLRLLQAELLRELAGVRARLGDGAGAAHHYREALEIFRELGAQREVEAITAELERP